MRSSHAGRRGSGVQLSGPRVLQLARAEELYAQGIELADSAVHEQVGCSLRFSTCDVRLTRWTVRLVVASCGCLLDAEMALCSTAKVSAGSWTFISQVVGEFARQC